jgi:hypothetical protein
MAKLTGAADFSLELTPIEYQFPDNTEEWDADWLVVRMHASDGKREWTSIDPAFLTWELRSIAAWCRGLAAGVALPAPEHCCVEPNLQLLATSSEVGFLLKVVFEQEFRPPGTRWGEPDADLEVYADFHPSAEELIRFADELEAELEPFPVRRPLSRVGRGSRMSLAGFLGTILAGLQRVIGPHRR